MLSRYGDVNLKESFCTPVTNESHSGKLCSAPPTKFLPYADGQNGDETVPFTSLQSTSGPQTTNGSESVDSGNTQVVQNVESSTGDVSQPLHNPAPSADAGVHAPHSPESSGTNLQLSTNSDVPC